MLEYVSLVIIALDLLAYLESDLREFLWDCLWLAQGSRKHCSDLDALDTPPYRPSSSF